MSSLQQDVFIYPETDIFWQPSSKELVAIFNLMCNDHLTGEIFFTHGIRQSNVKYLSRKYPFFEKNSPFEFFSERPIQAEFVEERNIQKVNDYYYRYIDYYLDYVFSARIGQIVSYQHLSEIVSELNKPPNRAYEIISGYIPDALNDWMSMCAGEECLAESIYFQNMDLVLGFNNSDYLGSAFLEDLKIRITSFAITIKSRLWIYDGKEEECLLQGYLWDKVKKIEEITQKKFTIKSTYYID